MKKHIRSVLIVNKHGLLLDEVNLSVDILLDYKLLSSV